MKDKIKKTEEVVAEVTEIIEVEETTEAKSPVKVAKAGKRSSKAISENEEKKAKEIKKAEHNSEEVKKVGPKPKTRSLLERRGKKYKEAFAKLEKDKIYTLEEAITLLPQISTSKFVGSAELHINLNVDPKHADQNIRATVNLPAGTGKEVKIAAYVSSENVKKAIEAGAIIAGEEEINDALDKNKTDFDLLITEPSMMVKLAKYARVLGPKGLMPNPKNGTVAPDVVKAISEAKKGKIEFRVDKQGIVHTSFGKLNFKSEDLLSNLNTILKTIKEIKPTSIKGAYIKSVSLAPSMGPAIKVSVE
jgi:large subunit ribosomal protein L1